MPIIPSPEMENALLHVEMDSMFSGEYVSLVTGHVKIAFRTLLNVLNVLMDSFSQALEDVFQVAVKDSF